MSELKKEHVIILKPSGDVEHIYDDDLLIFDDIISDEKKITRLSNIEPTLDGKWEVILNNGHKLRNRNTKSYTFKTRESAIKAEVAYFTARQIKGIDI